MQMLAPTDAGLNLYNKGQSEITFVKTYDGKITHPTNSSLSASGRVQAYKRYYQQNKQRVTKETVPWNNTK
jgi:hypothetical protein